MALYEITPCGSVSTSPHIATCCPDVELARVRSVAFFRKTSPFTDIEDPLEWKSKMDAGNAIVIPMTNGSYDGGGAQKTAPGYGDTKTRLLGRTFKISFKDPDYLVNYDYYNTIQNSSDWIPVFRTETIMHVGDNTCSVVPTDPVEDDIEGEVVWKVDVEWSSKNIPSKHSIPAGIFDRCYGDTD